MSDRLVTVIWKPAVNETDRPDLFNYGFFVYLVIPSLSLYRFQYFIPSLSRLPLGLLSGRSLMLLIDRSIQVSYFYFDFMFDGVLWFSVRVREGKASLEILIWIIFRSFQICFWFLGIFFFLFVCVFQNYIPMGGFSVSVLILSAWQEQANPNMLFFFFFSFWACFSHIFQSFFFGCVCVFGLWVCLVLWVYVCLLMTVLFWKCWFSFSPRF